MASPFNEAVFVIQDSDADVHPLIDIYFSVVTLKLVRLREDRKPARLGRVGCIGRGERQKAELPPSWQGSRRGSDASGDGGGSSSTSAIYAYVELPWCADCDSAATAGAARRHLLLLPTSTPTPTLGSESGGGGGGGSVALQLPLRGRAAGGASAAAAATAAKRMRKRRELDALAGCAKSAALLHSASSGDEREWGPAPGAAVGRRRAVRSRAKAAGGGGSGGGGGASGTGSGPAHLLLLRRGRGRAKGACAALCRACAAFVVFACVVATLAVMWLFVDLRDQVAALRTQIDQVVAGNQNVPTELQECHSLTRQLQKNQTALYNQIIMLAKQLANFSSKLSDVQDGFHNVQEKLDGAPELVNVPQTIKDLQGSVAGFGSQIRDLAATVENLKSQNTKYQELSTNIVQNLTTVRELVNTLLNTSHQPDISGAESSGQRKLMLETMDQISKNLSQINDTLSKRIGWVTEDQNADRSNLADLQDKNLNVQARVTTLEGECKKMVSQEVFNTTAANITEMVINTEKQIHDLDVRLSQLQIQGSELATNNSKLAKTLETLRQTILPLIDVPASPSPTANVITEQSVSP
ncbi:uncharacterized protein LOC126267756 [Schistocerca gregaria]|uniref:uncharacterized protein LOC126267756 n=1 Tax=Schistocerca gregaria TaxID=7010 RepID=UPI00211F2C00|nr:uncharacterized protein LOC126267756 [Schistocerca gregaria]